MKLTVLGAGREVGKSAVLMESRNSRILMDYGVKIRPEPPEYAPLPPEKPDAVVISHAHLDHSGALPRLYGKWKLPAYMTDVTLNLTQLLIEDSIKIAKKEGYKMPFSEVELAKAVKQTNTINYGQPFKAGNLNCSLFDAGHIPGSASVLVKGDKNLLYTGDIHNEPTSLLRGARLPKGVDVLVTESTYAGRNRVPREKEEEKLIESVEEVIAEGETALIPAFAVGRAQEVLLLLEKYAKYIALDGMAKKATGIVSSHGHRIKDAKKLQGVLDKIMWVRSEKGRAAAMKNRPIILSSAGMLSGGPIISYLRRIADDKEARIMFTGYLVEDSPGWGVLNNKVYNNEGEKFDINCRVEQYELSAHASREGLMRIIEETNPSQVVCVHGDSCEQFAKEIRKTGREAFAPANGETIEL
ncbi:MAG: MBL fold metallo-hydrolase [Candidatus Aenigmarchaeota archaeon]|nr:MBL fold metallo-hydrolase [Candidatus Aenigmarchaeota archaeon]